MKPKLTKIRNQNFNKFKNNKNIIKLIIINKFKNNKKNIKNILSEKIKKLYIK